MMYANAGLEATAINVAGVGTISTLNVNNDITCNHATTTNIIANQGLTLGQDGVVFGARLCPPGVG